MTNLPPLRGGLRGHEIDPTTAQHMNHPPVQPVGLELKQNVVYGMNYSLPTVDAFVPTKARTRKKKKKKKGKAKENAKNEATSGTEPTRKQRDVPESSRKSKREQKTKTAVSKKPVRYLVSEVPQVVKNRAFLQSWRDRDEQKANDENTKRPAKRYPNRNGSSDLDFQALCDSCEEERPQFHPFGDDNSVIWIPSERCHWEDSISEMTAVCTSAALRRYVEFQSTAKPFHAPLSRDYIRDRVDIDDPLCGYQIRHKTGGWLQGFVLFTNFTTWTHYFKWNSQDPKSGVPAMAKATNDRKVDVGGVLSTELEAQPRSGNPLVGGVVFPTIAEIGLLGGLGCGEYLLRMALDDIKSKGCYKFVVLQATDASRTFYERFGFTRVGAISRYGENKITAKIVKNPQKAELSDIIGYRHWTYAHESEHSLGKHGGPSYMMALRLEEPETSADVVTCSKCAAATENKPLSFFDSMQVAVVNNKPTVMQIGGNPAPASMEKAFLPYRSPMAFPGYFPPGKKSGSQKRRNGSTTPLNGSKRAVASAAKRAKYMPYHSPLPVPVSARYQAIPSAGQSRRRGSTPVSAKGGRPLSSHSAHAGRVPAPTYQLMQQKEKLLAPPQNGKLSYNQKQYQSIWLAVPPTKSESSGRKPPRERSGSEGGSARKRKLPLGLTASIVGARSNTGQKAGPIRMTLKIDAPEPKGAFIPKRQRFEEEKKEEYDFVPVPQKRPRGKRDCQKLDEPAPKRKRGQPRKTEKSPRAVASKAKPKKSRPKSSKPKPMKNVRKQRLISIPRTIPKDQQFYNKVVKLKGSTSKDYYFVMNYDHGAGSMRIAKLTKDGLLTGKRDGRTRYKVLFDGANKSVIKDVRASKYVIVPSHIVTKTSMIDLETWDVLDSR